MEDKTTNYAVDLANKKHLERISSNIKSEQLKKYWKDHNNIIVDEPFQDEVEEGSTLSREDVTNKTGDGSITPKTHIHETSAYLDESKGTFVTEYAYAGPNQEALQSHVVRFGINVSSKDVKSITSDKNSIDNSNKYDLKALSQVLQKNISAKSYSKKTFFKKLTDREKEEYLKVERAKLLKEKQNKINEYKLLSKNELTTIEKTVLLKSIEFLDKNGAKTTVVDIFARADKDGEYGLDHKLSGQKYKAGDIKYEKNGNIETHSVVLFKNNNKYLVIDPSNAEFSNVLITGHDDVAVCLSRKFQIYKTGDNNTGPDGKQWRDCIDIAVKLAFNINSSKHDIKVDQVGVIEYNSLKEDQSIQEVSNNPSLYNKIPDELKYYYVRAKQTSDIKYQKLLSAALKIYIFVREKSNSLITKVALKYKGNSLEKDFAELCRTEYDKINYKDTYESLLKTVKPYLTEPEQKILLGDLEHTIDEYIADNTLG